MTIDISLQYFSYVISVRESNEKIKVIFHLEGREHDAPRGLVMFVDDLLVTPKKYVFAKTQSFRICLYSVVIFEYEPTKAQMSTCFPFKKKKKDVEYKLYWDQKLLTRI